MTESRGATSKRDKRPKRVEILGEFLAEKHAIIKLCVSVRGAIETLVQTLNTGPQKTEDIGDAIPEWRKLHFERLSSVRR